MCDTDSVGMYVGTCTNTDSVGAGIGTCSVTDSMETCVGTCADKIVWGHLQEG